MFKKSKFLFMWQPIRRFEHGKKYFAKRKDKFYQITNIRSLVKAVEHNNVYCRVKPS